MFRIDVESAIADFGGYYLRRPQVSSVGIVCHAWAGMYAGANACYYGGLHYSVFTRMKRGQDGSHLDAGHSLKLAA